MKNMYFVTMFLCTAILCTVFYGSASEQSITNLQTSKSELEAQLQKEEKTLPDLYASLENAHKNYNTFRSRDADLSVRFWTDAINNTQERIATLKKRLDMLRYAVEDVD